MPRPSSLVLSVAVSLGLATGAGAVLADDPPVDARSHEQLRCDCSSGSLRRSVSLFANGTVRIRTTGGEGLDFLLAELEPSRLDGFRSRISEIDLSEVPPRVRGPSSETMEQCLLRLEMTSQVVQEYRFPRMAALPLALGRLLAVVDDLIAEAEERARGLEGLPAGYAPRVGDVLVKRDGSRHRVLRVTADGGGVEILALGTPLVVYLPVEGVAREFSEIESRRRPAVRRDPRRER